MVINLVIPTGFKVTWQGMSFGMGCSWLIRPESNLFLVFNFVDVVSLFRRT